MVYIEGRFILQTIYVLKNGNSSFFKPKICGLYTRAVTDQERVIVACIRYMNGRAISSDFFFNLLSHFRENEGADRYVLMLL